MSGVPFPRSDLLVTGYPVGDRRDLFAECARRPPHAVVFLANRLFVLPADREMDHLRGAGIQVRWVVGTHGERYDLWQRDATWEGPDGNLHGQVEQLGGLAVAGLGGQFREEVWWPREDAAAPAAVTREACWRRMRAGTGWRYGLPADVRHALFPEEIEDCAGTRADVLLTAEPPSCHPEGFAAVDRAAALCGARLVVHGHFLEGGKRWELPGGVRVRGVGLGSMLRLTREDLA